MKLEVPLLCFLVAGCTGPQSAVMGNGTDLIPVNDNIIDIHTGRPFGDNSIKGNQYLDINTYRLVIDGLVENPLTLSFQNILERPSVSKIITMNCVEGWSNTANWTGFSMRGLIDEVKPTSQAQTVIFHAADGYTTSFRLDDPVLDELLLVYRANGYPLPYAQGYPLRAMVESKYGYKLAKWITRVEFVEGEYRGYWEEIGYSNEGNVGGPAFD